MKKYFKIAFLILLGIFLVIQLFRPAKNKSVGIQPNNITKVIPLNDTIGGILKKACYDCHSNNTNYPWYAEVMPIGWLLSNHIKEGKQHLNFDEFATYSKEDQKHVLKDCAREVKNGVMPMESYTAIHKEAILTATEKELLVNWAKNSGIILAKDTNIVVQ